MQSLRYLYPQTVYTTAFWSDVAEPSHAQPTLVLTASREHVRWLRTTLSAPAMGLHTVATLQSYLLKAVTTAQPWRVITAFERTALVRTAWQTAGGPLYDQYGTNRGADSEMARILSYLSSQRTHWSAQNDMDPRHELTHIYRAYQTVLADHHVYAYDDLALHFNELAAIVVPELRLVACELQHATHRTAAHHKRSPGWRRQRVVACGSTATAAGTRNRSRRAILGRIRTPCVS